MSEQTSSISSGLIEDEDISSVVNNHQQAARNEEPPSSHSSNVNEKMQVLATQPTPPELIRQSVAHIQPPPLMSEQPANFNGRCWISMEDAVPDNTSTEQQQGSANYEEPSSSQPNVDGESCQTVQPPPSGGKIQFLINETSNYHF